MATVSEIMVQAPATLSPDATLEEAWKLMRRLRIRHVPVCQASALIGLVAMKDLMANVVDTSHLNLPVMEMMATDLITVTADCDLAEAATILYDRKISCLPVVDGDRLVGIVTDSDFLALTVRLLNEG